MKKSQTANQKTSRLLTPIVSTMIRISDRASYENRVILERSNHNDNSIYNSKANSYSIELANDKELLLLYEPNPAHPTDRVIEYHLSDKKSLHAFKKEYDDLVNAPGSGLQAVERPGQGPRGIKDKHSVLVTTYRAVYENLNSLQGEEMGMIINPPYPRYFWSAFLSLGKYRKLVASIGVGLLVGATVWAVSRNQHK